MGRIPQSGATVRQRAIGAEEWRGHRDGVDRARRDLAGHEVALDEAERRVETEVGLFNQQIDELRGERGEKTASIPMQWNLCALCALCG